ncbi:pentapeptide repeat-containing protein [Hyphobacterium sp.]|uniref:pentapeptide repeat-containing protein n=1 Tax=Hyphobacterium sp. TaxID=2004662 RepID=UPI003748BBD8
MKIFTFSLLALFGLLAGSAFAGDDHPHRTITISGECRSCELARENLYGAEILGAVFIDANFDGANLSQSAIIETRFMGSQLNEAHFNRSRLSGVIFHGSSLQGADFSQARGERVHFDASDMADADLNHSLMILASFVETDLSRVDFSSARLFNARFDAAILDETNFTDARLPGAILRNSRGQNVFFVGADMRGADLSGAHLTEANFEGANLNGARLAGAILLDVRGLTPEAVQDACRDAESRLPEGLELSDCSEFPVSSTTSGERPQTVTFTISQRRISEASPAAPRGDGVIRLELIREEQARAVAEFESAREALEITRRAVAEAQAASRHMDADIREEMLQEAERRMEEVEAAEEELQQQRAIVIEQLRNNPDLLRLVRNSGERLVYREDADIGSGNATSGSVIVDGNRYQLNGRYRWVFEMPAPPTPPEPPESSADPLGPKGPGTLPQVADED